MALGIGKRGSYATTEAPQDYISGALQNVENQGFRYRAERRLAEEEKKKAEEEKQQGIVADLGKINLSETTPYESHNALAIDGANKLFTFSSKLARDYSEGKISKVDYEIGKKNAMNQITLINEANKKINEQFKNYSTLLAKGELAPGTEQDVLRLGGAYDNVRMKWEINPQGTLEAIAYDEEGNIIERGGLDKFGNNTFKPIYNYDFDKEKKDFIITHPKPENDKIVGITIESTKGLTPEIREAINLKVKSVMSNPNALAIKAKEITGKINPNVTDEKIIKQIEDSLTKEYESLYAPEKGIKAAPKYDTPSGGSGSDKKDKKPIVFGDDPIYVTKTGTKANTRLGRGYIGYSLGNPSIDYGGGKRKVIRGIYASPYDNKAKLWVEEVGFESSSKDDFKLNATGLAKEKQAKEKAEKAGGKLNYNDFYATLSPNDYEYRKVSTKDTNERLLDFKGDAGEILEYANELGFNVGELETMYKAKAQRDKKSPTPESGSEPNTTTKQKPNSGVIWKK